MGKYDKVIQATKRLEERSCTCSAYVITQGIKQPYNCPHPKKPNTLNNSSRLGGEK